MSFSKIPFMVIALTADSAVPMSLIELTRRQLPVVWARSWDRLVWLTRERPVTVVVLDSSALPTDAAPDELVTEFHRRFPSLGTIFLARKHLDRETVLRLGGIHVSALTLLPLDDLEGGLSRGLVRAAERSTRARVLRSLGARLPVMERGVIRSALDGALLGWGANQLAGHSGWTRAHLSVLLRSRGLPSAGHLLLWAKLLHAGRWLEEPGRSAESVSRQLDYSNGAAFRRALRNYLGVTPTLVRESGGLALVLRRFLDACGLGASVQTTGVDGSQVVRRPYLARPS